RVADPAEPALAGIAASEREPAPRARMAREHGVHALALVHQRFEDHTRHLAHPIARAAREAERPQHLQRGIGVAGGHVFDALQVDALGDAGQERVLGRIGHEVGARSLRLWDRVAGIVNTKEARCARTSTWRTTRAP